MGAQSERRNQCDGAVSRSQGALESLSARRKGFLRNNVNKATRDGPKEILFGDGNAEVHPLGRDRSVLPISTPA